MSLFDPDKSAERMPVTLITGFLGSGKTTLLNRVLGDPRMARSLVLVNEFGEVGLDHLFMEQVGGDMVLLQSGCVCCTIQGDLDNTLRDIAPARTILHGFAHEWHWAVWLAALAVGWFALAVFVFHRGLRRYASASS